jgi:hypothetical protein
LGTVQIAGKAFEVFASPEWARYFLALNTQALSNSAAGGSALYAMLLNDAAEVSDLVPGPPGAPGSQGAPGPALFLLQESSDEQPMLMPPAGSAAGTPGSFSTVTAAAGFGCNGKGAQGAAALNAAATDLATAIALCNQLRATLIANGIAT